MIIAMIVDDDLKNRSILRQRCLQYHIIVENECEIYYVLKPANLFDPWLQFSWYVKL